MARYIRFVVHQRVKGLRGHPGLFTAAYSLVREGELLADDASRLEKLLKWFEAELQVPPRGTIPEDAIFWYWNAGPFSKRMWDLVHLVSEYNMASELITAICIGRVVYSDKHQVAAIPRKLEKRFKGI